MLIILYRTSIPNILINRLVLNLRQYDEASTFYNGAEPSLLPIRFAQVQGRILGSIGAPVNNEQWYLVTRFDETDEVTEENETTHADLE